MLSLVLHPVTPPTRIPGDMAGKRWPMYPLWERPSYQKINFIPLKQPASSPGAIANVGARFRLF